MQECTSGAKESQWMNSTPTEHPELGIKTFSNGSKPRSTQASRLESPIVMIQYHIYHSETGASTTLIRKFTTDTSEGICRYPIITSPRKIICDDEFSEDSKCSNSNLIDLDVNDHLMYMGYEIAGWVLLC
jgi:hypothetical protein